MERWRNAASEQAELLAGRVNELLSKGKDFLRSELGVDLALEPELIPPWAILVAVSAGLVLMLVIWASLCQALFKKRPVITPLEDTVAAKRGTDKTVKAEEPKKKKKKAEKKAQANGRTVTDAQEEEDAIIVEKVPHQQSALPQTKNEKDVETKKAKKKAKLPVKETVGTAVVKEPEEGTWETKVSNKEKREQRKKDKSDGSASPGGSGGGGASGTPVSITPEQRKTSAPTPPAAQKKKKVEQPKVTAEKEKVTATVSPVNSDAPLIAAGVADSQTQKVPQPVASKTKGPWTATREPAPIWKTDIDDSWTVIDRVPADMLSFTKLGVGTADAQLVESTPWLSQPEVDDEWSGFNGGSADLGSDWNAPSEVWGNYEEPMLQQPPSEPAEPNPSATADDDDEKNTQESAPDGAGKSKKKRKKKKKAADEGETGQNEIPQKNVEPPVPLKEKETTTTTTTTTTTKKKKQKQQPPPTQTPSAAVVLPTERQVKDITSKKPLPAQVPPKQPEAQTTVMINVPVSTQQKSEESLAKQSKKKKARRET
ncbi:protein LYRIC-like [Stigmatopora nigra]